MVVQAKLLDPVRLWASDTNSCPVLHPTRELLIGSLRLIFTVCSKPRHRASSAGLLIPRGAHEFPEQPNFSPIEHHPPHGTPPLHPQVLSVGAGNGYTGSGYTVCPHCFNNPPPGHGGEGQSQFRCFLCSAACPLAKKVQGIYTHIRRHDLCFFFYVGALARQVGCGRGR